MTSATDNRTTELLPCPFCGGEYTQVRYIGWESRSAFESGYRGECCDCGAITAAYPTEAEAIEAWNTRKEWTCHAESDLSEWVCSECQCWIPLGLTPENIKHASEWRYCPHCGARVKAVG